MVRTQALLRVSIHEKRPILRGNEQKGFPIVRTPSSDSRGGTTSNTTPATKESPDRRSGLFTYTNICLN